MIRIVQCSCANKHLLIGIAYNTNDVSFDEVLLGFKEFIRQMIVLGEINPWCDLCGCRDHQWIYEENTKMHFNTMAESRPFMEKMQVEQARIRWMFRGKN
jgi:hypothetical protein